MNERCVYQAFDANGSLLYVGYSRNWAQRWVGHVQRQPWWKAVAQLHIIWFRTPYEAKWYEGHVIRTARPAYNRDIPAETPAPDTLNTRCRCCGTWYAAGFRLPGTQCDDLSLVPSPRMQENMTGNEVRAMACKGTCALIIES